MKHLVIVLAATALATAGAGYAQQLPGVTNPLPTPRFTPKVTPTLAPVQPCQVDPAITAVTLTKGAAPLQVQISYTIVNRGRSAWRSGPNQQNVTLTARNANTGRSYVNTQHLTGSAPAGATMLTFTTPWIANAFDNFEFAGSLDLQIGYDPDIAIDANPCNDDSTSANNRFQLDNGQLLGFMKGSARTQTFHP